MYNKMTEKWYWKKEYEYNNTIIRPIPDKYKPSKMNASGVLKENAINVGLLWETNTKGTTGEILTWTPRWRWGAGETAGAVSNFTPVEKAHRYEFFVYEGTNGNATLLCKYWKAEDGTETGEFEADMKFSANEDFQFYEFYTSSTSPSPRWDISVWSFGVPILENIGDMEFLSKVTINNYKTLPEEEHFHQQYMHYDKPSEPIEIGLIAIREVPSSGFFQVHFDYIRDGVEVTGKTAYGTTKYNYSYAKVTLENISDRITIGAYLYDSGGALLKRYELSAGGVLTWGRDAIKIKNVYSDVTACYMYKQPVKEYIPVINSYTTLKTVMTDSKKNYNTKRDVIQSINVKNAFNTIREIYQSVKAKNTFTTNRETYQVSKKKFNTEREIFKSETIRKTYNTSTTITTSSRKVWNTLKKVCINSLGKYNTSYEIYNRSVTKYNTILEVNCTSKAKYNTERITGNLARTSYNTERVTNSLTIFKGNTERVTNTLTIFKGNTIRETEGKIAQRYNTSTVIIAETRTAFNTERIAENSGKIYYNTILEVNAEYRNIYDAERKVVCKVKDEFNTERDITCRIMRRYNTQRETDIIAVIKMLLGIQDSAKDTILRFLTFKAIEDIHAVCNLEPGELSGTGDSYFTAESVIGKSKHLQNVIIDLVIYYYRMQGMEHIKNESIEGGSWNYIYETIPPQIAQRLKPYKKMRAIRVF